MLLVLLYNTRMSHLTEAYQRLLEMPYLHHGAMPIKLDGSYSREALQRTFTPLSTHTINGKEAFVLIHTQELFVVVVTADLTEEGRYLPIMQLDFKDTHELKFDHTLPGVVLQVNSVAVSQRFQSHGIASVVYTELVDHGYAIVSDNTQFETAQGLWKKLSGIAGYRVVVADVDNGYFRDSNGVVIQYDGNNIPDADIWSQGSDYTGQYRVLILSRP
jgi:hypothetical protein